MSGEDEAAGEGTGADIVYLPRWRARGSHPGAHRGRDAGGPGTFKDQVSFLRLPDARRLDLRATLRDPFEGVHVRRFEARVAMEVWALVDLSASMRFRGLGDRMALAGALCESLAASATRIGDGFGLIACDSGIREELYRPATRRRAAASAAASRLGAAVPSGPSAAGLLAAAARIAGRPKLVFLVSDFRWPAPLMEQVFSGLAFHDLVPVLLADPAEAEALPDWGLIELEDLEGAGTRLVLMRPALRRRWLAREAERMAALGRLARRHGRAPFRLAAGFDPAALSRHLLGG
ncbi:MxaS protein [Methylobacterium dankookense]|uniref:DUF58 domain-containing protein n=1 Tax=Methylobacterium dankookense TaxID=560405 RepID=A0A564FYV9_9HYPH|nr:MxaS protein [Methylobacterium dankookense]GJD55914.1 hypothetical protein IFDJLNFL_1805 [Methylobacterium dankookense]VUF12571.1 hypothetical protein MTDSW087_02264 [Methylobacterium dankookense]